jgi:hypothetical protein
MRHSFGSSVEGDERPVIELARVPLTPSGNWPGDAT